MTQDASARLHLVTANSVAAQERPLGEQPRSEVRGARPPLLATVTVLLAVVLAALGSQPWQLPDRDGRGVDVIPQSLLGFLLLGAAGCVWVAGRVVQPTRTFRSAGAAQVWWLLLIGAAVVSIAADLSLASYAGTGQRPGQLLLRCAVPLVPAVLAGVLARDDGRPARVRAALGTGVVTVPLAALGWALLASPTASAAGPTDVLSMTLLAGLAPLVLAVGFVSADRRNRLSR